MDGAKRTLFLAASLGVFLAALGLPSVRLAVRYSENLRKSQSVFQTLRSAAARSLPQAGPTGEAWRSAVQAAYRDDDSVLLIVLHSPASGILHMVPRSAPYLSGSPQTARVPPELYYPPQTVSRLTAVVDSSGEAPVTLEVLYSLVRQRDVYEAARLGLILASAWTALSLLLVTAASLRTPVPAKAPAAVGVPDDLSTGPASPVPGPGLPVEDFRLPEIPPEPEAGPPLPGTDESRSGPGAEGGTERPEGLYSPESGLGWEEYLPERLGAELSRAASFEQDLVLLELSHEGIPRDSGSYRILTRTLLEFFSFRDLAFEQGPSGLAVILPNIDSDHALRMSEEFLKKVTALLREEGGSPDYRRIFLGLSSRSGRLVDAERVITEARAALARAREEGDSRIVAFKADPNKYRRYISARS